MSLQLIYTSAEQLLDTSGSGYGIVARSEELPPPLCRKLSEISRWRETKSKEEQYSYHVLQHNGKDFHVLSCIRNCCTDYTGRACLLAHHLILLPDEVAAMLHNDFRPSPAGVIQALISCGYWEKKWEGMPRYLVGEPQLSADDLPIADEQPVWKKLTGHKSNAKAFFTPPFDRDCLVALPEAVSAKEILSLLHESDWLSPSQGWGKTFTTSADDKDSYSDTLRMFCPQDSPLVQKAMRTGHPVLPISTELQLETAIAAQAATASQPNQPDLKPERVVPTYQYTEEPDAEIYGIRNPGRRRKFILAGSAVAALLLASGSIYWALHPAEVSTKAARIPDAAMGMLKLTQAQSALTKAGSIPYNDEQVAELLNKTEILLQEAAAKNADAARLQQLQDCVHIIEQASTATKHAHNLRKLSAYARHLKLNQAEIALLYMLEATHERPIEEWQDSLTAEERQDWQALIAEEPMLNSFLNDTRLVEYFAKVTPPTPTVEEEPVVEEPPPVIANAPAPALEGHAIPAPLAALAENIELTVSDGELIVAIPQSDGQISDIRRIPLDDDNSLTISLNEDKSLGKLELKQSAEVATIITWEQKDGVLANVRCGDAPAIICFPLPTEEKKLTNIILLPKWQIQLPDMTSAQLPAMTDDLLRISPENLTSLAPTAEHLAMRLQMKDKSAFPWSEVTSWPKFEAKHKFSFHIPQLTGNNLIGDVTLQPDTLSGIQCTATDSEAEDRKNNFTITTEREITLSQKLQETLDRVVNTGCMGEVTQVDPVYSLAVMYCLCDELDKRNLTAKQRTSFETRMCTLFSHPQFCNILHRILSDRKALLLSNRHATASNAAARRNRRAFTQNLRRSANRDYMRERICEILTDELRKTYTAEKEALSAPKPCILQPEKVTTNENGDLTWSFSLLSAPEPQS